MLSAIYKFGEIYKMMCFARYVLRSVLGGLFVFTVGSSDNMIPPKLALLGLIEPPFLFILYMLGYFLSFWDMTSAILYFTVLVVWDLDVRIFSNQKVYGSDTLGTQL